MPRWGRPVWFILMKQLGAANGLNDAFVRECRRKYIRGEVWRKQDNSRSRGGYDVIGGDACRSSREARNAANGCIFQGDICGSVIGMGNIRESPSHLKVNYNSYSSPSTL